MKNKALGITTILFGIVAVGLIIYVCCDEDQKEARAARTEQYAYEKAVNGRSEYAYSEYLRKFPQGKHAKDIEGRKARVLEKKENDAFEQAKKRDTETAWEDYLKSYPNGAHSDQARWYLQEIKERARWLDNSLSNGSQPYSKWYGRNRSCDEWGCSQIKVTAPTSSDVVVIIKRNNADGKVVRHAYICAGYTYSFEIPDGTYQVFFYYGSGWYPNKEMQGGVRGGFLKNEVFSKDSPQYLSNQVLTYVLQLQKSGNFSTKSSSASEIF